jgi:hydroxypyruvate isomerase
MPRFSLNVSMMLQEYDFLDRFAAAAELGFRGVDIQFPYDVPAASIGTRARAAGVEVVLINVALGERDSRLGYASDPAAGAKFRDAVARARDYSAAIGNRKVNVLAGQPPPNVPLDDCRAAFADNLGYAAAAFGEDGIAVMAEFVNGRDVPGFLVQTPDAMLDAFARAGHSNLALQFDLYHRQIMQGDLIAGVRQHLARIAHIQFADNPGRHEPGTGEINFAGVFAAIDALGYAGWVGAEYRPTRPTAETLGWMA